LDADHDAMDPADDLPIAFLPQEAHGLPGRLGFCPAPGYWTDLGPFERSTLAADLACLRDRCGASVLVTLLEEEEMSSRYLAGLFEGARAAGLESLWLPIRDNTAPIDSQKTVGLVDGILEHLAAGRTVVIHCQGGIGRSGTIAACCLVAAGQGAAHAIELVRKARFGAATAPGQEKFVYEFAKVRRAK
jgi:cyclin-dependent kinase inhibitor 3